LPILRFVNPLQQSYSAFKKKVEISDLVGGGILLITRNLIVSLTISLFAVPVAEVKAQSVFPAPLPSRVAANDPAFPPVPGQAGTRNDPAFPPLPGQTGTRNDPAFPPVSGQTALRNDPAFPPVSGRASFPAGGTAPIVSGGFASGPLSPTMGGGPSDACMKGFLPLREEAEKRGKLIRAASERHAPPDEACKLIENFGRAEINMIKYVEANASRCGIPPQIHVQMEKGRSNTEIMQKKVCTMAQQRPAGPSLSEALGASTAIPTAAPTKQARGSVFDTLEGNVLER
jgi:hypothetical protein